MSAANAPSATNLASNRAIVRFEAEKNIISRDNTLGITLTTIEAVMTS